MIDIIIRDVLIYWNLCYPLAASLGSKPSPRVNHVCATQPTTKFNAQRKKRNMSVNIIYSQDLNDPGMVERMWQVTPNVIVSARHAPQIGLGGSSICIHTVFI